MRNKILIVDANREDIEELEQILQEIVDEGGELFFAYNRQDGIMILKREQPQLVFLDASMIDEADAWTFGNTHIITMHPRHEPAHNNQDFVVKPLKRLPVLQKCRAVLHKESDAQIPPM